MKKKGIALLIMGPRMVYSFIHRVVLSGKFKFPFPFFSLSLPVLFLCVRWLIKSEINDFGLRSNKQPT